MTKWRSLSRGCAVSEGENMGTYALPDASGHYGPYGGRFVAETLIPALEELEHAY